MSARATAAHVRQAIERRCDQGGPARALRIDLIAELRRGLEADWYAWLLTDPGTSVGVDPLATVPDLAELPRVIGSKYCTRVNRWTELADVSALGSLASTSRVWQDVQRAHGVVDVASAVFRDQHGCWGFLDLWSTTPYSDDDLDLLRSILPSTTAALRRSQAEAFAQDSATAPDVTGPAVLLLTDDLGIVGHTEASTAWLGRLLPAQGGAATVPAAAYNVAAQLLAVEEGIDSGEPAARVHLGGGVWLTLRASRVTPGEVIAVTIEPTAPDDRLDLFARACALTRRERELVTLLSRGADTAEVAVGMRVSRHTVQDHLKSIFDKTGVRSRRELLARVVGVPTIRQSRQPLRES